MHRAHRRALLEGASKHFGWQWGILMCVRKRQHWRFLTVASPGFNHAKRQIRLHLLGTAAILHILSSSCSADGGFHAGA